MAALAPQNEAQCPRPSSKELHLTSSAPRYPYPGRFQRLPTPGLRVDAAVVPAARALPPPVARRPLSPATLLAR